MLTEWYSIVDMLRYAQLDIFAFGQIRYVFAMLKLDML